MYAGIPLGISLLLRAFVILKLRYNCSVYRAEVFPAEEDAAFFKIKNNDSIICILIKV